MLSKVVDFVTAPIWVPAWMGVVAFRWLMGRDLGKGATFEPDPLG